MTGLNIKVSMTNIFDLIFIVFIILVIYLVVKIHGLKKQQKKARDKVEER